MSNTTLWILASVICIIAEISTVTFYFLFLALGAIVAGILAWCGFDLIYPVICAGIISILGIALVSYYRSYANKNNNGSNDSNNLDIGNQISISSEKWTQVSSNVYVAKIEYRGSLWDVKYTSLNNHNPTIEQQNITYTIYAMQSNILLLNINI
jgi:membrane protein implicated in regulation of membrane protease activity